MGLAQNIIDSVVDSVKSGKNNGYGPSTGSVEARKAVAKHVSVPGAEIRWDSINVNSNRFAQKLKV